MRSGKRAIILLSCLFFMGQIGLVLYLHTLPGAHPSPYDTALDAAVVMLALGTGIAITRFQLATLDHLASTYAARTGERIADSLEQYHAQAQHEELLVQEASAAIERELASARKSLEEGHSREVRDHLASGIEHASKVPSLRCENITAAAVLEAKARQCAEAGVSLAAAVALPQELPLKDIELGSILFNLIDNALNECRALVGEGRRCPELVVRARVQAGQLVVEVTNPCRSDPAARMPRPQATPLLGEPHGWGTGIVATIAHDYGGIASFVREDERFCARVMIPLHGGSASERHP